jgi:hypothetical protein
MAQQGGGGGVITLENKHSGELATVNLVKNRIYLRFMGFLSLEEAEQLRTAYEDAISRVGQGFTVVSIFDNFKPGTQEVQDVITSMIQMASAAGCTKEARVSMGSVLGSLQLGRLSKTDASYPSRNFETLEEADTYLDSDEE